MLGKILYKYRKAVIIILLLIMFIISVTSVYNFAITYDEICYIGLGKYFVNSGFKLDGGVYQGPLSFYLNSLPLYFMDFKDSIWDYHTCWFTGKDIVFNSGYDSRFIVFLSRLPLILTMVLGGIYVYLWSSKLYKTKAAIVALILYSFSISVMGIGRLMFTDTALLVFIFIASYYFWGYLRNRTTFNLIFSGMMLALAILSKASGLYLIPIFIFWYFFHDRIKKPYIKNILPLIYIFIIAYFVIFLSYGFQFGTISSAYPAHYDNRVHEVFQEKIENDNIRNLALFFYEKVPVPAPTYYAMLGHVGSLSSRGVKGFFFGELLGPGEKPIYYNLMLFLIKSQVSLILFVVITLIFFRKFKLNTKDEYYLLTPILFIFIFFTLNQFSYDIRHILPIYPFLFVFVSKSVNLRFKDKLKDSIYSVFVIILIAWYIISALLAFPFYLSYFNEFVGGSKNGYKYLLGANLDQGQDIYRLKEYLDQNNINHVYFSFHGAQDPSLFGINHTYLPTGHWQVWVPEFIEFEKDFSNIYEDCNKKHGYVVISATNLQNRFTNNNQCFDWLKEYEPKARIGNSLFVYEII